MAAFMTHDSRLTSQDGFTSFSSHYADLGRGRARGGARGRGRGAGRGRGRGRAVSAAGEQLDEISSDEQELEAEVAQMLDEDR